MHATKQLLILLMALLAMVACDSQGDEPGEKDLPRILLRV